MQREPRRECPRCGRPEVTCYCPHVERLPTRTKLLVLQHPREEDKAVGTARMAALCVEDAQVAVGLNFASHARVQALLRDPERPAVLLYPGAAPRDLATQPPSGPVTLVVLDGTWHQARSLARHNPWLLALPQYAFAPQKPSEYRIRREPKPHYVSTIEAVATALGLLEGDPERFQALLKPFRAMVDKQLDYVATAQGGRRRRRRRREGPALPRLPAELSLARAVCVSAEANAWPHDRGLGRPPYPHELVHWAALRLSTGASFEALLAARQPLSSSPLKHSKLTPEQLRDGLGFLDFERAWQGFCDPADVICSWGHYGTGLLRRDGGSLPAAIVDMRKVAGDFLRKRPGSAEDLVKELDLDWQPCGAGRCGERLGMLVAITQHLLQESEQRSKLATPLEMPRD